MRTRVALVGELTEADWQRWERLTERAVEPNGWLDPIMLRPAAAWPAMSHDLHVAMVEDDTELRAVMAFSERRLRRAPLTVLATDGAYMTAHADRHHPLVDRECTVDALGELVAGVLSSRRRALLDIGLFPSEGPLSDALDTLAARRAVGVSTLETVPSVRVLSGAEDVERLPVPDDPQATLEFLIRGADRLKGDHRRKLWSKVRIAESSGVAPFRLEDWSARPDIADEFIALQSQGWKGNPAKGGAGLATDALYEQWFRNVIAEAQRRDALVAVAIVSGERLVALNTALLSGGVHHGFVDVYDEDFAAYGPGVVARVAMWRWCLEKAGATVFDPGLNRPRPENARIYPDACEYRHVVIGAGSPGRRVLGRLWGRLLRMKSGDRGA